MTEALSALKKKMKKVLDKERYQHTLGVMYTAAALAMAYGEDLETAMTAGVLHDCAKCIPNEEKFRLCKKAGISLSQTERRNPSLIHAKLGAYQAEVLYGIKDPAICHAILVHTTGAPEMNRLDKILYIADYIEPNRDQAPNLLEVRRLAFQNLDLTMKKILSDSLEYLSQSDRAIDPMTFQTYQYFKRLTE